MSVSNARVFRVLNVDDYDIARYAKSRVLRQADYEVLEARSGAEALRLVQNERPDLVVLDVKLPDMDGIEVCRQIKANSSTASVLVLQVSATFTEEIYRIKALESGADSYLVEPVAADELLANVRALLRLRRAEDIARAAAQEAERRRREAETFAKLVGTINASLDLDATLQAIGLAARALTGSDFVRVALRKVDSGALVLRYRVDEAVHPYAEQMTIVLGQGVGGQVLRTGCPFRTDAYLDDDRVNGHDVALARAERVVASLAVPVLVDGQLEGLLYAINCSPRPFADADETTLQRLADHAAIAVRNSRLYARAQAARADAEEANRAKDAFLAVLSHELRTPLQPILGWVQVARGSNLERDVVLQALDTIERNARSQAQLIDDLLDVSAIITGKLRLAVRAVALAPVVEAAIDVVRPAAQAKGIAISSVLDPAAGPVSGDPDRLQQVVWNLLSNAVKFTPRGVGAGATGADGLPRGDRCDGLRPGHSARVPPPRLRKVPPGRQLERPPARRPGAGPRHSTPPDRAARGGGARGEHRAGPGRVVYSEPAPAAPVRRGGRASHRGWGEACRRRPAVDRGTARAGGRGRGGQPERAVHRAGGRRRPGARGELREGGAGRAGAVRPRCHCERPGDAGRGRPQPHSQGPGARAARRRGHAGGGADRLRAP
jgi:signal transduction histidine kinase/DNA-binding response OmpR family regulator